MNSIDSPKGNHVILLGGGITNLACAFQLSKAGYSTTIIEKETFIGGLSATHDWDGFKFDYGTHNYYSHDPELINFFKENLHGYYIQRKINVQLHIMGKFISFPLTGFHIFSIFTFKLLLKAGFSFLYARVKALIFGYKKTERLDEWIIQRFGKILYKIYLGPFITQVQKKDPRELSKDIGEKKIKIFSIRHYLLKALSKNRLNTRKYHRFPDFYYLKGGFGKIAEVLSNNILQRGNTSIQMNEQIRKIHAADSKIISLETDKQTISTNDCIVVSSIPLSSLIEVCPEVFNSPNSRGKNTRFEYTKMRFFLVKINKEQVMGYSWISFNNTRYPYYRVTEFVNNEYSLCPPGMCSLMFELALNQEDELWSLTDEKLLDRLLPLFNEVFTLKREDIIDYKSLFHNYANPRMVISYKEDIAETFRDILQVDNLFSIGRQGLFTYINVDECIRIGINFANSIIEGCQKKNQIELLNYYHSLNLT